ncbi:hypothetical protein PVAG01_01542 [Phlyctema vagabunda]|uniref:DUF5672 domain-containing protein n=1 Tax=Phlyctema vagabunda TaxID=108571 RepID=A0ABR4PXX4_9HELO
MGLEVLTSLWFLQPKNRKRQIIGTAGTLIAIVFLYLSLHVLSEDGFRTLHYTNTLTKSTTNEPLISVPTTNNPNITKVAAPVTPEVPVAVSPYDPTKVAFMVETRPLPHLPALFTHMISLVPNEWTFKFMGSPESMAHLRSSSHISSLEESGKLVIVPLPSNYSVADREAVSQMFTDIGLYRDVLKPAENLLVWQPDSIFCANSKESLNDWLKWDWVGAPWSATAQYGGNGGLSLRKVSRILKVLEKRNRPHFDGALEDLWLTSRLAELKGAKMPNATISKHFSVESVWDDNPLGYHVGWLGVHHEQIWDSERQVKHIMEYCPEVKIILGMSLAGDKPDGVSR